MALPCCDGEYPCEISLSPTHKVSCYRYYENNERRVSDDGTGRKRKKLDYTPVDL